MPDSINTQQSVAPVVQPNLSRLTLFTTIIIGIVLGFFSASQYEGRWLLKRLTLLGKEPLLEGDRIVPPGIGFNFFHNIKEIPDEVFRYSNETTLLHISKGRIKSLPPEIGSLSFLSTLEVRDSSLKSTPPEIAGLVLLEKLDLGGNEITVIPPQIGNLISLKKLYLYDNRLETLPNEIGNLVNLEILDLRQNSLRSLPFTISNLINLRILYLGGNKITPEEAQTIQNLLPNTVIFF